MTFLYARWILELKKQTETEEVKKNVRKLRKLLLKLNRGINSVQKTSYQHLVVKRRHREFMFLSKKEKKKTVNEARERSNKMNTINVMTKEELMKEMTNDDEDDFDLRWENIVLYLYYIVLYFQLQKNFVNRIA